MITTNNKTNSRMTNRINSYKYKCKTLKFLRRRKKYRKIYKISMVTRFYYPILTIYKCKSLIDKRMTIQTMRMKMSISSLGWKIWSLWESTAREIWFRTVIVLLPMVFQGTLIWADNNRMRQKWRFTSREEEE